jgi:hypothetical protein
MGRWETDWKAQVNYTVFLGSAEFVAQMRKLLRGDRDQQTGVRRGALEALTRTRIRQSNGIHLPEAGGERIVEADDCYRPFWVGAFSIGAP